MFVSIACGAISGFHATQSPMMARCIKSEKYARPVFYGAMVTEGVVALIWAAAAIAFTGGYTQLQEALANGSPAVLVNNLSENWLGAFGGVLAVLGVIAAPITTGDTALRSARLIAADFTNIKQKKIVNRFLISIPIFLLCFIIMMIPYDILWRYFAWCNQTLSVFTLWAITIYLASRRRFYFVSLIPALFMTCVTVSYIFYAPEGLSLLTDLLFGLNISHCAAISIGVLTAVAFMLLFVRKIRNIKTNSPINN
jgi:carbon starvation protein CstA